MGSGKVTSFDLARLAGVSQATVSRALRDSPLVNAETRERIKQLASEVHYQVDRRAAGLRSQQTRTIALLLHEDPVADSAQINPFFLTMVGNVARVAAARSYDVLVSFQQLSDDWLNDYQVSNRADGLILLGYGDYGRIADKLRRLREDGCHFTIWGVNAAELEGNTVGCRNIEGGGLATQHLLQLGRRRIAFLGGKSDDCPELQQRHQGYCQAIQAAGLPLDPTLQADADMNEQSGFEAIRSLFESGVEPDAIFAATDLIAFGAMQFLRQKGIAVPEQVAVVGFDDLPAAAHFSPALTTVRQDTRQAAEALVDNLLAMIRGESVVSTLLPLALVVRDSCGHRHA